MDFTLKIYKNLLTTLQKQGFSLYPYKVGPFSKTGKIIILRHDVDKLPWNALRFAQMEHGLGIRGTYYFRIVPQSFDPIIIEKIVALGHEIGYHYEDINLAYQQIKNSKLRTPLVSHSEAKVDNSQQIFTLAIEFFEKHLEQFCKYYPVKTICMHGSPLSKFDNKLLWKYYDYKNFGIDFEPYFDLNFEDMLYLTDTGRRWNGDSVSVRDKAYGVQRMAYSNSTENNNQEPVTRNTELFSDWKVKPVPGSLMNMTEKSREFQNRYNFRSTYDIIKAVEKGELPDKIMMTVHPQRWTDKLLPWVKELFWQNVKNVGKWGLVKIRQ